MLDIKYVRENLDEVARAMENRNANFDIELFQKLDNERRELITESEQLQSERNRLSKEIGKLMSSGQKEEAEQTKDEVRKINKRLDGLSAAADNADAELRAFMMWLPNMPDATTPIGADENDNPEVRRWGTPRNFTTGEDAPEGVDAGDTGKGFEMKPHWDLGCDLGIIDFERGVKLAESRFYVLGGAGAKLERALISFMLDQHTSRGYKEWWVPAIANSTTLTGTAQLPKFEDDLYKTTQGLYLIPTAEVQLTNLHAGEILNADALPLRYCAFTPCFREEAGSAGRDTRGIIRVHQFSKVEMVKYARPEEAWDELELMVEDAENILQKLELPYRVISLCTGDIGFSAAKTYDVEVWMPSYDGYKEISSCSCCTDFQARRANIRYKDPSEFKGTRLLYTLNGSGLAVGRCMAAILENYQNADGSVTVPSALVPYMGGMTRIETDAVAKVVDAD